MAPSTTLVQQSLFRSFEKGAKVPETTAAAVQMFPNDTILFKVFKNSKTGEPETYRGLVIGYEQVEEGDGEYLYLVEYEDGDREHMEESELKTLVRNDDDNNNNKITKTKKDPSLLLSNDAMSDDDDDDLQARNTPSPSGSSSATADDKENMTGRRGTPRRRAACKRVNYMDSSDGDDDVFLEEEEKNKDETQRARRATKKPAKKKAKTLAAKRKKKAQDSEESEASFDSHDDDDESLDMLDQEGDEDEDDFSDEEEYLKVKPTKRSRNKPAAKKQKKEKPAAGGSGPPKKKMSESFQPINAPTYPKLSLAEIRETKDYLDPCGMEATDDIIDRLVGEQVDKISGLLDRALESGKADIGSLGNPLKLGTACSGTDAPSLALTLVQEQLELRGKKGLFHHSHLFSCENEPFKQAYLARNFDSSKNIILSLL